MGEKGDQRVIRFSNDEGWTTICRRRRLVFQASNTRGSRDVEDIAVSCLVDVYVANKMDRGGLRFGLMKRIKVCDEIKLEEELNGILISVQRLRVNIAKFKRRKELPFGATNSVGHI
ncbi:hypothetical protein L1887_38360 [Cichorium endivia]|nr:hypothetical protein L1887_38360 [Cichorium endivia]